MKNIDFLQSEKLVHFDIINFAFTFLDNQVNIIIEKIDVPHFGVFDSMILISLISRAKHNIFLEYHREISQQELDYIDDSIQTANYFLASIGFEHSLFLRPSKKGIQADINPLFKSQITNKDILLNEENINQIPNSNNNDKSLPLEFIFFKNSLKLLCEDIVNTTISTHHLPLFNQKIDFKSCTNCIECVHFCPTDALFQNENKDAILFQSGKCIGCNICHDVCKENAIHEDYHLDLIEFMFTKTTKLVEFKYVKCQKCNNEFIDKNKSNTCFSCNNFTNRFKNMFKISKDL